MLFKVCTGTFELQFQMHLDNLVTSFQTNQLVYRTPSNSIFSKFTMHLAIALREGSAILWRITYHLADTPIHSAVGML